MMHDKNSNILIILICFALLGCAHTSNTDGVRFTGYIGDGDYAPSKSVLELLSDHALVTPGGHAYLYLKKGDGNDHPPKNAIADIHLRVLDASDKMVSEDSTTVTLDKSSPILEDMVTHMVVGDKVRVWGDSYLRVWEIELLAFHLPPAEPNNGVSPGWPRYPEQGDAKERKLKHANGEKIQKDQFIHIQKTLWKSFPGKDLQYIVSYDSIIQVNPYVTFERVYNILTDMSVGEQVRIWYPQKPGYPDIVSDIWIIDRYPQYETPEMLKHPEDKSYKIDFATYKKMIHHSNDAPKVGDQDKFKIVMNCWDSKNGDLITTTDLNYDGKHSEVKDSLLTRQKLRNWRDIVGFEMPMESAYSWCEFVQPNSFQATQCAQLLETEKTFKEMELRAADNYGYKYKLSFAWQKIMKDASYGDIFMIWLSHNVISGTERAKDSMHPDHYLDLTCRVRIDR
ncbi:MAG: hypothetical protein J6A01_08365 [Proteobacteria bacterium]|nr:hypothetical protein [Pseudomonadota bacterium]